MYFPSEPSYQGRSLSEWLVDVDNTHYSNAPEKAVKAAEAIRKMGAKTLPFLLADLGDVQYKRYSRKQDQRTPEERISQAIWAFDALGSIGKQAIPELVKLLDQTPRVNPGVVPLALAGIGPDAMPELLSELTNANYFVRENAASGLANAIANQKISANMASAALPIALNNLKGDTRWQAVALIQALHLEPDESVPALIKCMEESMNEAQFTLAAQCAVALSSFGDNAQKAIPSMIKYMDKSMDGSTNLTMVSCSMQFALALGNFGREAQAAIPVLIRASNSTNAALSQVATQSLKQIR